MVCAAGLGASIALIIAAQGAPPSGEPASPAEPMPSAETAPPAEPALPAETRDAALSVDIMSGIYLPRLNGDVSLGPGGTISVENALNLNAQEIVFNAELTLRKDDRFLLRFGGLQFETDTSGVFQEYATFGSLSLAPGDAYDASVDLDTYFAEVGVDLPPPLRPPPGGPVDPHPEADLRFTPFVSLRYLSVDQVVERPGIQRVHAGGTWASISAGFEMRMRWEPKQGLPLGKALRMGAGATFGAAVGGDGGTVWTARATIVWEPIRNVGLLFGYRLVELNVDNDDYTFDAGLQGLFVGGSVRF